MNNSDQAKFAEMWISVRTDIYDKPVSDGALDIVFSALSRFELIDIAKAIEIHVNDTENGRFPIMPAHIVANIEGAGQERAAVAWDKLSKAVLEIGPYQDVVFDDAAIHAIVETEGGWLTVCSMTDDDFKYFQNRFSKLYLTYVTRREFKYPRLLKGIANAQNSGKLDAQGAPIPINKPSVIGDKDVAREVLRGGTSEKLKITHGHEIESAIQALLVDKSNDDETN